MTRVVEMVVAVEMLLLPVWAGFVGTRHPASRLRGLVLVLVPVAVAAAVLACLTVIAGETGIGAAVRSQAVAAGFAVLLAGAVAILGRAATPRPAQFLTAVFGWAVAGGVFLASPLVQIVDEPLKTALVRAAVHTNPLVVAENELGLRWLRQGLTYRWTGLGESYSYLFGHLAWWKTLLAHVFVGSGLMVFSIRRSVSRPRSPDDERFRPPGRER